MLNAPMGGRSTLWWREVASQRRAWKPTNPSCHVTCPYDYGRRFLANFWQTVVRSPWGGKLAGLTTRPGLLVWRGAPRRNRTGDPILTMDRQPSAVLAGVSAGGSTPWMPQLCAQFLHLHPAASTVIGGAASARRRRVLLWGSPARLASASYSTSGATRIGAGISAARFSASLGRTSADWTPGAPSTDQLPPTVGDDRARLRLPP